MNKNNVFSKIAIVLFLLLTSLPVWAGGGGRIEAVYASRFEAAKGKVLKAAQDITEGTDNKAVQVIILIDAATVQFEDLIRFVNDPSNSKSAVLKRASDDMRFLAQTYANISNMRGAIMEYRQRKQAELIDAKNEVGLIARDMDNEINVFRQQIAIKTAEINNTPSTQTVRIQELTIIRDGLQKELASLLDGRKTMQSVEGYIAEIIALFKTQDEQLGLLITTLNVNASVFQRAADIIALQSYASGAFKELKSVKDFSGTINALIGSWKILGDISKLLSDIKITG
jgi:hypothetical protein